MKSSLAMVRPYFVSILLLVVVAGSVLGCGKVPSDSQHGPKRSGDNGYRVIIGDEPTSYIPGKTYNLFLLGSRTHGNLQQFTDFMVNAKSSSGPIRSTSKLSGGNPKRVGRFQLFSDSLSKFNDLCVNTVSAADDLAKSEIQVMWVAPKAGSGCVAITAMVYESPREWWSDDGQLTKIICEANADEIARSRLGGGVGECCACDEAKYNFVFEGIWSNESHPRDYPFAIWLTHFSDVIGASHDSNFSFWGENHIATDGFRSLAEWGSVRLLETELRAKGPRLRTLIKSAGLWYPDVNTNTSSNFRVDRQHHKLSVVSMFGPSPDWVVGVSGLNLCTAECSWTDSLDIDLFPWDAGTDNGITYMSPNAETQPRERMYQITPMYPEDPRQPFYNPKNMTMTPLARLYIRKVKTIPQNCDTDFLQAQVLDVSENTEEGSDRVECGVTEFSSWTPCSVTCGKGIRMRTRQYSNLALSSSANCNRQLINKEMCVADVAECEGSQVNDEDDDDDNLAKSAANTDEAGEGVGVCRTTKWADWSPCSATCGIGISMRTRTFIEHAGRKKCPHITVVEKEKCMKPECSAAEMEVPDPECPVTLWSDWSPCSVTCGSGVRIRTRQLLIAGELVEMCTKRRGLYEQQPCSVRTDCLFDAVVARGICSLPSDIGPCRGAYNRFAFNSTTGECGKFVFGGCRGNQNNFLTEFECQQTCVRSSADDALSTTTARAATVESEACTLTPWTEWTPCSVSCGYGITQRTRRIISGGPACAASRLRLRKRCYPQPC